MMLIVRNTGDRLFSFINIDDFERPWTTKLEVFVNFSWLRAAAHVLRVNWAKWQEIDLDSLCTKFSALNINFSSLSTDPLSSRRPAHAGVKKWYPLKVVILLLLARVVWKRMQISAYMLLIITRTIAMVFLDLLTSMTLNDFEPPKEVFSNFFRNFSLQRTF